MRCARLRPIPRAALALAFLSLMVSSAVEGQGSMAPTLELIVEPYEAPIVPGGDPVETGLIVQLDCQPPDAAPALRPVRVALQAEADADWATVIVDPPDHTVDECPMSGTTTVSARLLIALNGSAPAGARIPLRVTATAGEASAEESWEETVGIDMAVGFILEETMFKSGPNARVGVPLTIFNEGNDAVRVSFKRGHNTSEHLNVALPGVQLVAAGERSTVNVDVQTPFENGFIERRDMLHVVAVAHAETNATVQTQDVLSAEIETVGTYLPGPAPALLLLALASIVHSLRRAKKCSKP